MRKPDPLDARLAACGRARACAAPTGDALLQRVIRPPRKGKIKAGNLRASLINEMGVRETDAESLMIIDALINDHKTYTWKEATQMLRQMLRPAYQGNATGPLRTAEGNESAHGNYPVGFESIEDFQLFIHHIRRACPKDAKVVFHGSSLSGESYVDKGGGSRRFDVGRESDYDVAIISPTLFKMAEAMEVKIRGKGSGDPHTEPLTAEQIAGLGLGRAHESAELIARREVNFMIYPDDAAVQGHSGNELVAIPGADSTGEDYRETFGSLLVKM
jgi:hypothetical protein